MGLRPALCPPPSCLQSASTHCRQVYSAYIGYFQLHNIPWYDRSWGHLFSSFEEFVAFSWPVITVTDVWTGRPHIVTRLTSIGAFLKMIKTRYGETLPQAPNILQVTPFETASRHLRTVSDYPTYKKLHATLPAAVLSAFKLRVRAGEPKAIRELWAARDRTFLAVDFEWSERNEKSCLEWGYAAVRCAHLEAAGHWPPAPDANYRKGHYIVSEYVDKVVNKHCPTHPWQYAFGESQVCAKAKLPQIIQAVISSLASPDSETIPNTLVLVAHGIGGDLQRMEEMKIKLPHNMLILDTATFERVLFATGHRGTMADPHTAPGSPMKARTHGSTLSLENLLRSLPPPAPADATAPALAIPVPVSGAGVFPQTGALVPGVALHNAGNDAFVCLYALQLLLEPEGVRAPVPELYLAGKNAKAAAAAARPVSWGGGAPAPMVMVGGLMVSDFAQMAIHAQAQARQSSRSPGPRLNVPGQAHPHSPGKHANGNGSHNGNGRSSRRLSAVPTASAGARRG
ncbi:hypothetical protein GGX14DRAFT_455370 [Mycena pura]|uniref:Gfd2/YDR514C-like C-terminal domain-containing protein n=1 Tax=Mycena pura TaxID=153505 RepID=A0AAD6Y925_9AGAR|nr:hypothetical protein GGX14DRAFT_455370 [Mycena pura]